LILLMKLAASLTADERTALAHALAGKRGEHEVRGQA
jgi:hypothetical protein